jgi:hypothetical protein
MIMRHGRQCLLLRRSRVVAIIVRDGTREEFAKRLWDCICFVLFLYCIVVELTVSLLASHWMLQRWKLPMAMLLILGTFDWKLSWRRRRRKSRQFANHIRC